MNWRDLLDQVIDQVFDFFCRTQRPPPEDTYQQDLERENRIELAEFDSMLRRELKMSTLPWENVAAHPVQGAWNQLLQPGLSAIFAQQQSQYHNETQLERMQRWALQTQQRPLADHEQLLRQMGLQNRLDGPGLEGLSQNLLQSLLGYGSQKGPGQGSH